jgi:MoaA/NifB/PqqE/SkfB family radical SAM enzyme
MSLASYREVFEARLGPFLTQALRVTFTGFGELLAIPEAEAFLDHLNRTLPRTEKILTTNGTSLTPGIRRRLGEGRTWLQVSLHASTAALHEEMTGLGGAFDGIVESVAALSGPLVELVFVMTSRNVDDLPGFVRLAWNLRARRVRALEMEIFSPEALELSTLLCPGPRDAALARARAVERDLRSREPLKAFELLLPGPSSGGRVCEMPWRHLYADLQGPVLPCCRWGTHAGDILKEEIGSIWNGPVFKGLRRGLASGRLPPFCRSCPGPVTNRLGAREKVLARMREMGLDG